MGLMSPNPNSSLIRRVPLHYQSSNLTFPTQPSLHQGHNSNFPSPYSTTFDFDLIPIPSSPTTYLINYNTPNATTTPLQSQEGYYNLVGPTQNYQVKDNNALHFIFGSGGGHDHLHHQQQQQQQQASCSSSDGSSNNSTTTFAYDQSLQGGLQNYNSSYKGVDGNSEKVNGFYGDSSLDCSLEEIKQLISTNHCSNNLNFFVDAIKTEEKVMYY
jgi:hypothetical protein